MGCGVAGSCFFRGKSDSLRVCCSLSNRFVVRTIFTRLASASEQCVWVRIVSGSRGSVAFQVAVIKKRARADETQTQHSAQDDLKAIHEENSNEGYGVWGLFYGRN